MTPGGHTGWPLVQYQRTISNLVPVRLEIRCVTPARPERLRRDQLLGLDEVAQPTPRLLSAG